jgi:hypothetical protein
MWIGVPVVAFGGIAGNLSGISFPLFREAGIFGCIAGSFLLAYIALKKPRKDIVSLAVPLFTLIMFLSPDVEHGWPLQILFAASITILAIRLEKRFSTPLPERSAEDGDGYEEEDEEDEQDEETAE